MKLKKYMKIDLIILSIILIIALVSSRFLKEKMDSKIFFSFEFFVIGIILIRWRHKGLFAIFPSLILSNIIMSIYNNSINFAELLTSLIFSLILYVVVFIIKYLYQKNNKIEILGLFILFLIIFFAYCFSSSISLLIVKNRNFITTFFEGTYINSLSFFVTIIISFLFRKNEGLLVNQEQEFESDEQ